MKRREYCDWCDGELRIIHEPHGEITRECPKCEEEEENED